MPGLAEVKADLKLATEQIATANTAEELRDQLLNNLLPVLEGIVEATSAEIGARDEVITTLIQDVEELQDEIGDMLQPENAARILAVLAVGEQLAKELTNLAAKADEVTKKRIAPLIKNYKQGAIVLREFITEITIPIEEPDEVEPPAGAAVAPPATEDDDDDDEDDDEDDEDDEEDDDDDDDDDEDDAVVPGKVR